VERKGDRISSHAPAHDPPKHTVKPDSKESAVWREDHAVLNNLERGRMKSLLRLRAAARGAVSAGKGQKEKSKREKVKQKWAIEPARSAPIRMRTTGVSTPANVVLFWGLAGSPTPGCRRECAAIARALALNLEVLGRGLAAIGNFFVFYRLSFVER
jgi:hypothetical protein